MIAASILLLIGILIIDGGVWLAELAAREVDDRSRDEQPHRKDH